MRKHGSDEATHLYLWRPGTSGSRPDWKALPNGFEYETALLMSFHARVRERTDEPLVATISTDRRWIVATFSRTAGNVWTNPELTCQHADPEVAVHAHGTAVLEEKTLIINGSLDDVLRKVRGQRSLLRG